MSTTVTFAGNLAEAPELHHTRESKPFVTCRVLVNRRIQKEWVSDVAHELRSSSPDVAQAAHALGINVIRATAMLTSGQVSDSRMARQWPHPASASSICCSGTGAGTHPEVGLDGRRPAAGGPRALRSAPTRTQLAPGS